MVVLRNRDASILAEAGGRQFYKGRSVSYSDLNRVTQSLRQPGSAMKPIVYLAAFRTGMLNLETVVPDEPISVPNGANQDVKWISNYDGQFKGMIPARIALAESRNAVAIWIAGEIGISSVLRTARSLGIQTPLQPYATTALGASEVTLMELANAYRTMASGILTQPYVIRRIVRDSGQVVSGRRTLVVFGSCRGLRPLAHSGRHARCRALAHWHGSRTGLQRFPDCRDGEDWNDQRVQGRALRGLHLRPGGDYNCSAYRL